MDIVSIGNAICATNGFAHTKLVVWAIYHLEGGEQLLVSFQAGGSPNPLERRFTALVNRRGVLGLVAGRAHNMKEFERLLQSQKGGTIE
jgi:hypothetical protein